jgi:hypothetical protein
MVFGDSNMTASRRAHQIQTAETFYTQPDIAGGAPHRAARVLRLAARAAVNGEPDPPDPKPAELAWRLFGPEVEPPHEAQIAGTVTAYINEARWIAGCPDPRCNAAQVVSPADPRFLCAVCGNVANRRQWYAIEFPPESTRARIEKLVARRPRVENVNWTPGESVDDVRRLNVEHGVSDGDD